MEFPGLEVRTEPESLPANDLSIRYLQAELARIDVYLKREISLWQKAGQEPSDTFRGLYISDQQALAMMNRPMGTNWGHSSAYQSENTAFFEECSRQTELKAKALANILYSQGRKPKLHHLRDIFGLSEFDVDVILICLAPSFDLRYENVFGYLQDNITLKNPSVNLVLDLLCRSGPNCIERYRHFNDPAPLLKNHLIRLDSDNEPNPGPLLRKTLSLDPTISTWLLGAYQPAPQIRNHTMICQEVDLPEKLYLTSEILSQIDLAIEGNDIIVFIGPDRVRQDAAASYISKQTKRSVIKTDMSTLIEANESPIDMVRIILRDARLLGAIPYFGGWEVCLSSNYPLPGYLEELCYYPDLVIISSEIPWQAGGIHRERIIQMFHFQIPSYQERLSLWEHFTQQKNPKHDLNFEAVAGQFHLTAGQIRDAVATAVDIATQKRENLNIDHLFRAARCHSNPNLMGLARKLTPRYGWEDIVLPDDQLTLLQEIVSTVRCRPRVLEDWGVGRKLASSHGVTALFSGPPGTGKTMAAEIIASELRLDLFKIDLSSIVSKYIGETEKNLERIFTEAETSNAILFFDEADALFGKRSEVRDSHDRYANIEISFLLQRMEAYNGVTILATNLRANLDEAFTRRLQFAVDFPFPESPDRLRIWKTLFPAEIPQKTKLDFEFMADTFRIAGGNIRNIIINAAYLAADDGKYVTMEHLLHGARRELQKMGRLIEDDILSSHRDSEG